MSYVWLIIAILFLVLLQVGLFNSLGRWHPDVVLLFLGLAITRFSKKKLLASALAGAIILDFFSSLPFGILMLGLFGAVMLLRFIGAKVFTTHSWLPALVIAFLLPLTFHVVSYLVSELYYYLGIASIRLTDLGLRLIHSSLPLALINTFLMLLLLLIYPKVFPKPN